MGRAGGRRWGGNLPPSSAAGWPGLLQSNFFQKPPSATNSCLFPEAVGVFPELGTFIQLVRFSVWFVALGKLGLTPRWLSFRKPVEFSSLSIDSSFFTWPCLSIFICLRYQFLTIFILAYKLYMLVDKPSSYITNEGNDYCMYLITLCSAWYSC